MTGWPRTWSQVTPLSEKSERAAKESVPSFDYGGANDTASAEMDLAPLLRRLTPSDELEFRINRTAATTPRRNREAHACGTRLSVRCTRHWFAARML